MGYWRLTVSEREALRKAVLRVVTETFDNWLMMRTIIDRGPPRVTVGYVVDFLRQASYGQPRKWDDVPKYMQMNAVASALRSLRSAGALMYTWGKGYNGREARCWEPTYQDAAR